MKYTWSTKNVKLKKTSGSFSTTLLLKKWVVRFSGEGNGNPLQYSCLENPVDRGAWWATVPRIAKSWTRLKEIGMHACIINYTHQGGRIWHQNDLTEEKYIYECCQLNSWMWMWIKFKIVDLAQKHLPLRIRFQIKQTNCTFRKCL